MAEELFAFRVSHVTIGVSCDHAEALAALRGIWGAAEVAPNQVDVRGVLSASRGLVELGSARRLVSRPEDLLPVFEGLFYEALPGWHPPPLVLLHAAAVVVGERTWVLPAVSGGGKSSMALALVELGARYLTDELTVFDGTRVWGLPRAIQFDPTPVERALPERLLAADRTTYLFRDRGGQSALPFVRVSPAQMPSEASRAASVRVALLVPSDDDGVDDVAPTEALTSLLESRRSPVEVDLGPLLHAPVRVRWRDPRAAARLLVGMS